MSSEIAIAVENLSKCFMIYDTPRDRLKQFIYPRIQRAAAPLKRMITGRPTQVRDYYREFWALKNVSFEVKKGEAVGIIGRNGSGKSTLLQMICGTLTPSGGTIRTHGRIAALLELGSGFNPEFTGRENVYMNAAVLGLSNDEINARFDDIASFADIGDFIEQPVKTYSSGMVLRLAFAVIAHVDADILVVDEALAVGDAVFTQKCMRFIRSFMQHGTLLFVSHDMGAVMNLCQSAVWLHKGLINMTGQSKDIAEEYLHYTLQEVYGEEVLLKTIEPTSSQNASGAVNISASDEKNVLDYESRVNVFDNLSEANGWKTGAGEILSVQLKITGQDGMSVLKGGEWVSMVIRAAAYQHFEHPILGFLVRDRLGQDLFGENTLPFTDAHPKPVKAGTVFEAEFSFRLPMMPNGHYSVMASLANGDLCNHVQHHWLHDALILNVSSSKVRWGLLGVPFEKVIMRVIQ